MKLPLKARILQYALQQDKDFTVKDVIRDLEPEYRGEKMFSEKQVEDYFDSYLGVGFFKATKEEFDSDGRLLVQTKVTDYGRSRGKYIG